MFLQHPIDPFILERNVSFLEADVKALRLDYKQLKETQDTILRTQQQLVHHLNRIENMLRGSQLSRHHLQYPDTQSRYSSDDQDVTPIRSAPSSSLFRTPTQSSYMYMYSPSRTTPSVPSAEPHSVPHLSSGVLPAPSMVPPSLQVMGGQGSGRPLTCPKLVHKQADKCLPSTAVVKQKLLSPAVVIAKYPKLLVANKAPTLAMKLAREAYFGEEVMAQCTVMGCREYPGLPCDELSSLKETIFGQFPAFWTNPVEFESVWVACVDAIGQACKCFRHKQP